MPRKKLMFYFPQIPVEYLFQICLCKGKQRGFLLWSQVVWSQAPMAAVPRQGLDSLLFCEVSGWLLVSRAVSEWRAVESPARGTLWTFSKHLLDGRETLLPDIAGLHCMWHCGGRPSKCHQKLGIPVHICGPSSWGAESGESGVQIHPQLHSEL